jgi:hypothetical protein
VPFGVVLASSMSAYNSRVNHHGYAPVQLLTGAMPRMPSTLTSSASALDIDNARDEANALRVHLDTQPAARAAFAAAETSARVRRAVNSKVRNRLLTEANLPLGTDVLFFTQGLSKARPWKFRWLRPHEQGRAHQQGVGASRFLCAAGRARRGRAPAAAAAAAAAAAPDVSPAATAPVAAPDGDEGYGHVAAAPVAAASPPAASPAAAPAAAAPGCCCPRLLPRLLPLPRLLLRLRLWLPCLLMVPRLLRRLLLLLLLLLLPRLVMARPRQ